MKFFVDTADVSEIGDLAATGLLDGVTTNPSLIMKAGRPMAEVIAEICELVDGPVSAEVVATDPEGMIREGRHWASLHENIVVKCPCTPAGLQAINHHLSVCAECREEYDLLRQALTEMNED